MRCRCTYSGRMSRKIWWLRENSLLLRSAEGSQLQKNCCEKPSGSIPSHRNSKLEGKCGKGGYWCCLWLKAFHSPNRPILAKKVEQSGQLLKSFSGVTLVDPSCIYTSGHRVEEVECCLCTLPDSSNNNNRSPTEAASQTHLTHF